MKITVYLKQVYGKDTYYPADELAIKFAKLIRQKTFTRKDLELVRDLGVIIEVRHEAFK